MKKVSTTSGFLENCAVEFGHGLTCIIGARGTCKSTLIESIRFAFETDEGKLATLIGDEKEGDQNRPVFRIIGTTLRAGSVRCEIETFDANGARQEVSIEREVGAGPRIFVDGVREHTDQDLLHQIEIFSQGDLQRITEEDNDDLRLALIDRPHKKEVVRLNEKRLTVTDELSFCGLKIRNSRERISTLNQEITLLSSVKGQLDQHNSEAPVPSPALEEERDGHIHRQLILTSLKSIESDREKLVRHLQDVEVTGYEIIKSISEVKEAGEGLLEEMTDRMNELVDNVDEINSCAEKVRSLSLESLVTAIDKRFEEASERYYQLRQQEQAVNESLKRERALKRQLQHLEQLEAKKEEEEAEETKLVERRQELRTQRQRIDDKLYALRHKEIDFINREHGDTVILALSPSSDWTAYSDRLQNLITGSRIRLQEDVAKSIAKHIKPSELIDLVETGDAKRLANLLERDLGQMMRIITHFGDHPEFYELEKEMPTDRLRVNFLDNGNPKPVETLSKGQRATALLPIILRPLPYPLLFDQPEDDLDNRFIFKSLVKTVRQLKSERQLIFVTHNANIPVLGDAEEIVVMRMENPEKAHPASIGNVDSQKEEILDLLEGGAEAFEKRERYYGGLLSRSGN